MFLKNCWYVAAWDHELSDLPIARRIIGEAIVVYRLADGELVALQDRCPHRHAPLSRGKIEGRNLRCGYHGLVFGPGGECLSVPGGTPVPRGCGVRTYPAVVRNSWVWVWMGEHDRADRSLIPTAFGLDDSRWLMRAGQLDYQADYQLVNDNLCDLSHVDFVHAATLAHATGGGWSDDQPKVEQQDRGLRISRWFTAKPASPTNAKLVDTWSSYTFKVPGIFVMENKSYPHGMAEACGGGEPATTPMTYRVEQQAVTPLSATETRYFFASGFDSKNLPARLIEPIFETIMAAFAEDHALIEAQQRVWDTTPVGTPKVYLLQDKAPVLFRRMMSKLIDDELLDNELQHGSTARSVG